MAQMPIRDSLVDLERHRLRLEDNLEKLRKALRHWQTWEAEYEGLKEEIQALPPDATAHDLIEVGKNFGGDLVTEKEIKELLGIDKGLERNGKQVVELLVRRIDYVQRNVESIQKQVDSAEFKLGSIEVVSKPEARNEEGLPITEIYEELDEDGNVIASRTSHPDDARPQILEALKKVGLQEVDLDAGRSPLEDESNGTSEATSKPNDHVLKTTQPPKNDQVPIADTRAGLNSRKKSVSFAEGTKDNASDAVAAQPSSQNDKVPLVATEEDTKSRKKSVSFAEGTKQNTTDSVVHISPSYAIGKSPSPNGISALAKGSFEDKDRVIELDEDDIPVAATVPKVPIDESPEDAALRRQMQAYSMREVGEIVAQLDLEENGSHTSYDDDDNDSEHNDLGFTASSEDDEDENQYGMSADGHMSEEYKQEMFELEKKLNARMLQNVGPSPNLSDDYDLAADARKLVVQREKPADEKEMAPQNQSRQKDRSVRFAESLDIAPNADSNSSSKVLTQQNLPLTNSAVKDRITERSPSTLPAEEKSHPVSRFKAARQAPEATQDGEEMTPPHRSSDNPLAANIIERPPRLQKPPPDEFDPAVINQELNSEYYRQRNRIIQKQGGFKRHMQDDENEFDEEEDDGVAGPRKKVSLFKAARAHAGGAW